MRERGAAEGVCNLGRGMGKCGLTVALTPLPHSSRSS